MANEIPNSNSQINIPMPLKERRSRRIKVEVGRILVEPTVAGKKVGYLGVPEDGIRMAFNILAAPQGVWAQPLCLHMSRKDFMKCDAHKKNNIETFLIQKTDEFYVRCLTVESLIDFLSIIQCETVVLLPAGEKGHPETVFKELAAVLETNQYDFILTNNLDRYGVYGFLSMGHKNLEIIGCTSRIEDIFCAFRNSRDSYEKGRRHPIKSQVKKEQ